MQRIILAGMVKYMTLDVNNGRVIDIRPFSEKGDITKGGDSYGELADVLNKLAAKGYQLMELSVPNNGETSTLVMRLVGG